MGVRISTRRAARALALVLGCVQLIACAGKPDPWTVEPATLAGDPALAGTAFDVRKREMEDALASLAAFRKTLESLRFRPESANRAVFEDFVEAYVRLEVDPLDPAGHPELVALDASLELLRADLLVAMDESQRADAALDALAERFRGRESVVVAAPDGERAPLGEAIQRLRSRPWWRR